MKEGTDGVSIHFNRPISLKPQRSTNTLYFLVALGPYNMLLVRLAFCCWTSVLLYAGVIWLPHSPPFLQPFVTEKRLARRCTQVRIYGQSAERNDLHHTATSLLVRQNQTHCLHSNRVPIICALNAKHHLWRNSIRGLNLRRRINSQAVQLRSACFTWQSGTIISPIRIPLKC